MLPFTTKETKKKRKTRGQHEGQRQKMRLTEDRDADPKHLERGAHQQPGGKQMADGKAGD